MIKWRGLLAIGAVLLPVFSETPARADEGMWMVHAIQEAVEKTMQARGLELSAAEIYNADAPGAAVSDAVVSLGFYCTASVISDEGLLLTNHHCAFSDLAALSTEEHNYLEDGYWAFRRQEEIPLPGRKAFFLKRVLDVTDEVEALKAELTAQGEAFGSRKLSARMERKYAAATGLEASLHAMWAGEKYYLALYRAYEDVRLVGAPPVSVAAFGGDEDNWEWPQHKADFALYRIYEGGEPLESPRRLQISTAGYKEGDFTMVLGYPGRTDRYSPSAKVDYLQQVERPVTNRLRGLQMEIVRKAMDEDPEIRRKYADWFFSLSNIQEMQEGEAACIRRFHVIEEKRSLEEELGRWIAADPERTARWGALLADLQAEYAAIRSVEREKAYYRETIVRGTRIAPAVLRMSHAAEEDREAIWRSGLEEVDPGVEKALLALALKEYFGHVEIAGERQCALRDSMHGDWDAMAAHLWERPRTFMDFLTEVKIGDFHSREEHMADLPELLREYTRALYRMRLEKGVMQYPDANSTMRLTYGRVSGLEPRDAVVCASRSTVAGLREKNDPAKHDFALPPDFLAAVSEYDGPVNFLTDNDITGGNSGSPVLNARGELIGLAFDGNKESLASDVFCTPSYNKCVCVDIRYILWILRDYVRLDRILREIAGGEDSTPKNRAHSGLPRR